MNPDNIKVFLLEFSPSGIELVKNALKSISNIEFYQSNDSVSFKEKIKSNSFSAIISYGNLINTSVSSVLNYTREIKPDTPFFIISEAISESQAFEFLSLGVNDYFLMNELNKLSFSLIRTLRESGSRKKVSDSITKLQASEEKFRKIFETIGDVYYQTDINGNFTLLSPSTFQLLGYHPEELIGTPAENLYEKKELRQVFLKELSKSNEVNNNIATILGKNGNIIHVSRNVKTIFDQYGNPKGIAGTIRNITEKKNADDLQAVLYNITNSANRRIIDLTTLSEVVHKEVSKIIDASGFYIALFDEEKNSLKFPYFFGDSNNPIAISRNFERTYSKGFPEYILETKKTLLLNYESLLLFHKENQEVIYTDTNVLSCLAAPLKAEGKVIGVIVVQSYKNKNAYSQKDLELLTFVSKQIASAINTNHSQNLLIESEKKFRKIFESITDVYYQADLNGTFTMLSPSCFQLSGYLPDELVGMPLVNMIDNPHAKKALLKDILKENNIYNLETKFTCKNGKKIDVSANISLLLNNSNTPIGTQGTIRNITENKKQSINLGNALKLNQEIINSTDQLFYVLRIVDEKSHINPLTYVSPQSELIYGLLPHEIINNPEVWFNSIHPEDKAHVIKKSRLLFKKKEAITRIYRIKQKSTNEFIWVEDYVVPLLNELGEIQEIYGSIKDISQLKHKEIELEKTLKDLSNRYNELMQFNYIVSHNLRAPIANIVGLSTLINRSSIKKEEKLKMIGHILDSSLKMDSLIKDLSMILANRSAINEKKEIVTISDIYRGITQTLEKEILESKCTILTNIQNDANELFTIKSYFESILYNIISNAIKYKSPKRVPRISVSAKKINREIELTISDNGIGIDLAKNGKNIFGLYKRFNFEVEGKGLGLHMSKTQVYAIGGKILVESNLDVGTTFTIFIPTL